MIHSHYIKLERPYRIIYAKGNVGLQIATLIVVDDQNNPTYKGIKTYSYPVVSYVGKDAKTKDIPYSDVLATGEWSEGEVWTFAEQKDVATLGLQGGTIDWATLLDVIDLRFMDSNSYNATVEAFVGLRNNIEKLQDLGCRLEGPKISLHTYKKLADGSYQITLPMGCVEEEDEDGNPVLNFYSVVFKNQFPLTAQTSDVDEAVKMIRRQTDFYKWVKDVITPGVKLCFMFTKADREFVKNDLPQLAELIEKLNQQ